MVALCWNIREFLAALSHPTSIVDWLDVEIGLRVDNNIVQRYLFIETQILSNRYTFVKLHFLPLAMILNTPYRYQYFSRSRVSDWNNQPNMVRIRMGVVINKHAFIEAKHTDYCGMVVGLLNSDKTKTEINPN